MKPIHPTPQIAAIELRLEWMLKSLLAESLRHRTPITMPILIGGTALRRAYRLTRPSTDLDFAVRSENEMTRVRNTITRLARKKWPKARTRLRTDGEEGWRVEDEQGTTLLHIGGLTMGSASLDLACWTRDTWTLPIGRLATMKIKAGTELRHKARDLYDMGFIAENYPGEINQRQAESIREEGFEAMRPKSKRADDYEHDQVLHIQSLTQMGQDVTEAANEALLHIQGAREGQWENQSTAALGLAHAVDTDPLGRWEVHRESTAGHMLCVWRAPNGEPTWRAIMENERRTRSMLAQADLEHHPAMRPKPTTDSTGQQTCREQARSDKTRAVARDRLQLKDRLKRSFNADRDRPRENRTPWT